MWRKNMGRIAVATCPEYRCIESGMIKGRRLAETIGRGTEFHVHTPVTKNALVACLKDADYAILSFHAVLRIIMKQRPNGEYSSRFTVLRNLHSSSLRTYSMRYSNSSLQNLSISVVTSVLRQAGRRVLIVSQ